MAVSRKLVLLNHLFPAFQSLEGKMLVSFYPVFEIPSAQRESPYLLNQSLQEILSPYFFRGSSHNK